MQFLSKFLLKRKGKRKKNKLFGFWLEEFFSMIQFSRAKKNRKLVFSMGESVSLFCFKKRFPKHAPTKSCFFLGFPPLFLILLLKWEEGGIFSQNDDNKELETNKQNNTKNYFGPLPDNRMSLLPTNTISITRKWNY